MEQEQVLAPPAPTKKIYMPWMIYVATFIGGPLVTGYMTWRNFRVFGDNRKATISLVTGIVATIGIISLNMLVPDYTASLYRMIPIGYTLVAYALIRHYQIPYIESHRYEGGPIFGWGRSIVLGLASLAILFITAFWIALFTELSHNA